MGRNAQLRKAKKQAAQLADRIALKQQYDVPLARSKPPFIGFDPKGEYLDRYNATTPQRPRR